MPWRGEVIERALAVALGGGLLSVMLKLGTQAPDGRCGV